MRFSKFLKESSAPRVYILGIMDREDKFDDIVESLLYFSSDAKRAQYIRESSEKEFDEVYEDNPRIRPKIEAMSSDDVLDFMTNSQYSLLFTEGEHNTDIAHLLNNDLIYLNDFELDYMIK